MRVRTPARKIEDRANAAAIALGKAGSAEVGSALFAAVEEALGPIEAARQDFGEQGYVFRGVRFTGNYDLGEWGIRRG